VEVAVKNALVSGGQLLGSVARKFGRAKLLSGRSLRFRLYGGFGAVVVLLLIITGVSLLTLSQLSSATRRITEVSDPKERAAAEVRFDIGDVYGLEHAYVLGDHLEMRARFVASRERLDVHLKTLEGMSTTAEEREHVEAFKTVYAGFLEKDKLVWQAVGRDRRDDAIEIGERQLRPVYQSMLNSIENYITVARLESAADVRDFNAARDRSRVLMGGLGLAALLLAGIFAWLITRSITRPLSRTVRVLEAVADGDLTRRLDVSSSDEVGRMGEALNRTLEKVRSVFGSIGTSAEALASASEELTAVSQQMASSAEETSVQANVVSAAAEQVSGNVQLVATNAEEMTVSIREVSQHASHAATVATQGAEMADQANVTVARLGDASRQIGDIVKLITSIAEQTNLLALNATIEAARAGDAGRGFAVVAHEVKELSSETSKATSDIAARIKAIQGSAADAAVAIEAIGEIIGRINESQVTISSAVEEQTATTNSIGQSVTDAADGTTEIARSMAGVASAAQATTAGASETQRAAVELSSMAATLRELVDQFQV